MCLLFWGGRTCAYAYFLLKSFSLFFIDQHFSISRGSQVSGFLITRHCPHSTCTSSCSVLTVIQLEITFILPRFHGVLKRAKVVQAVLYWLWSLKYALSCVPEITKRFCHPSLCIQVVLWWLPGVSLLKLRCELNHRGNQKSPFTLKLRRKYEMFCHASALNIFSISFLFSGLMYANKVTQIVFEHLSDCNRLPTCKIISL